MKLERNGWELTPKVRIEVQDVGEFNYQTNRAEDSFPLKRTKYEKLYLDASDNSMKTEPVKMRHMYLTTVQPEKYASITNLKKIQS